MKELTFTPIKKREVKTRPTFFELRFSDEELLKERGSFVKDLSKSFCLRRRREDKIERIVKDLFVQGDKDRRDAECGPKTDKISDV